MKRFSLGMMFGTLMFVQIGCGEADTSSAPPAATPPAATTDAPPADAPTPDAE
jgi:hypothetical protein